MTKLKRGDHIYRYCVFTNAGLKEKYTHHGIYCGDNTVIHYHKDKIRLTTKSKFANGKDIHIKKYKRCDRSSVAVRRAKSREGEKLYNLVFNNCEHFAYWCKTGIHKSEQVDSYLLKKLNKLDKSFKLKALKILSKLKRLKSPRIKVRPKKIIKIKLPKLTLKI